MSNINKSIIKTAINSVLMSSFELHFLIYKSYSQIRLKIKRKEEEEEEVDTWWTK